MFGMGKKKTEQTKTGNEEDIPKGPLDDVQLIGEEFVFNAANDNEQEPEKRFDGEDLLRVVSPERFNGIVIRVLGYVGRKTAYDSLQIDETDEDFQRAVEVCYRRLSDSAVGPVIDKLSDQAIEDILIITMGFGPVVKEVMKEHSQKKKLGKKPVVTEEKGEKDES